MSKRLFLYDMVIQTIMAKEISVPEPAPKNEGEAIFPLVLKALDEVKDKKYNDDIVKLLNQRNNYGLKKYGQGLMSKDGHDSVEDCVQEIGDCIQYFIKAKHNKEDLTKIKQALYVLNQLVDS